MVHLSTINVSEHAPLLNFVILRLDKHRTSPIQTLVVATYSCINPGYRKGTFPPPACKHRIDFTLYVKSQLASLIPHSPLSRAPLISAQEYPATSPSTMANTSWDPTKVPVRTTVIICGTDKCTYISITWNIWCGLE